MAKYKEVDGVRYQVVNNTFLGSNLIPVDAGGSLPEVDGSDNGKVLTVVAGEWDADAVPKELPSVAGNAGKVLTVNSGATGAEWKDAPSGLPAVTIDDAGDVLTVNASGEWEAAAPGGGGGGLTLYGPYSAGVNSAVNVSAGAVEYLTLDNIHDNDGVRRYLPADGSDLYCLIIAMGAYLQGLVTLSANAPMYFAADNIWADASITVENISNSAVDITTQDSPSVVFYSTAELSSVAPGPVS